MTMSYAEYKAETLDPRTQEAFDYCNELNAITNKHNRYNEISEAMKMLDEERITFNGYIKMVIKINKRWQKS